VKEEGAPSAPIRSRGGTAAEKRLRTRDSLWPEASKIVWSRKTDDGYCSLPRTLPLIMTLINILSPKGKGDASRVYQELWFHDFDLGFIDIGDERAHAFAAGYTTPSRGVRSWYERISVLEDLGFIMTKPQGSQRVGYVLLVHPHDVVESLRAKRDVPEDWYGAFTKRVEGTGARQGSKPSNKKAK
jgi:hypothetical protein